LKKIRFCPDRRKARIVAYSEGETVKDIVKGTALSSLICLASVYIPVIGFFFALFIPLPVLFYRSKLGRKPGIIIFAATILVTVLALSNASIDLLFFAELLFLGFMLSELFYRSLSVEKTVLYTSCAVLATSGIGIMIYGNIQGAGIYTLASEYVATNLKLAMDLYKSMGVSEDNIRMISDSMDEIKYVFVRIIPALIIVSTLFVSWISLLISKQVLVKKNLFYPDFGTLNLWKAPEYLVWVVIASSLMLFIPDKSIKVTGINILLILMAVYFFQGIAIVSFYFKKKQLPQALKVFLYSLIALQHIIFLFIIGLGFFDVWLNVRKIENS
jgi:uncharacterized protein YybS (DUF2232 family)